MTDETPREYKESTSTVLGRSSVREATLPKSGRLRPRTRKPEDYAVLKATISSAVAELKLEMEAQHQQTREVVKDAHREVLAAIKASPAAYVKIITEFGALFLGFALVLRVALKIELLNPIFAVFSLFSMMVYWFMAHVREKADKRQGQKERA